MDLHDALAQISEIRGHLAQNETFRGYRAATIAATGVLGLLVAAVQPVLVPRPAANVEAYLALWIAAAAVSVAVTGTEIALRCRRADSPLTAELTRLALTQFSPCLLAGALMTYALVLFARESLWMLPGLWATLFSLGVFASCRLLPRPSLWIGVHYLLSGTVCLALARGEAAFSPWAMAGTFGVGQLLTAAILYYTLERTTGDQQQTT